MTGTPWWATLLTALAGGAIALAGALVNGSFDRRRARREEWFRRVRWAHELTAGDRERDQAAGYRMLEFLSRSNLAASDDLRLLFNLTEGATRRGRNWRTGFAVGDTETSTDGVEEEE